MTALARADAPSGADTADRPACLLRRLRIHGRMFLRNADSALPLHAADETSSEHGAKFIVGAAGVSEAIRLWGIRDGRGRRRCFGIQLDRDPSRLEAGYGNGRLHGDIARGANCPIDCVKDLASATCSLHQRQVNACSRGANTEISPSARAPVPARPMRGRCQ